LGIGKAFDHSAIISNMIFKEEFDDLQNLNFSLQKNNETVQIGNTKDMIFDFDSLITFVSQYITLRKGDLIFTGTPAGVGPVKIGDKLEGFLEEKIHVYLPNKIK
jgi:acylpyruvate hydrolase